MITRIVKMTFREEEIENFRKVFEESKNFIRAFEGNEHVELLQDVNDKRIFFTRSIWQNEECLENYRHSDLFEKTWARTKILFADKPAAWSTRVMDAGALV